jgi:hypothetical protein
LLWNGETVVDLEGSGAAFHLQEIAALIQNIQI